MFPLSARATDWRCRNNRLHAATREIGFIARVLYVGATAIAGGCAMLPSVNQPVLAPASLPLYEAGDSFIYDNGRTETVISANYGTHIVNWTVGGSRRDAARPNFIIPSLAWRSGGESGGFATSAPPGVLWPLRVGSSVRFEGLTTTSKSDGGQAGAINRIFECHVGATKTVATLAGTFDTFVVDCSARDQAIGGSFEETIRWFYAPAVEHYVLKERLRQGETVSRMELVSVDRSLRFIDDDARANTDVLWQRALQEAKSGEIREWTAETSPTTTSVIIVATYSMGSGVYCRRYRLSVQTDIRFLTVPGIACKGADGLWRPM